MIKLIASRRFEATTRFAYGGGSDYSSYAQSLADTKTNSINSGLNIINAIYGGGSYGANAAGSYTPGGTYYDSQGNVYNVKNDTTGLNSYLKSYDLNNYYNDTQDYINKYNAYAQKYGADAAAHAAQTAKGATSGFTGNSFGALTGKFGSLQEAQDYANQWENNYQNYLASNGQLFSDRGTASGFNQDFYDKRKQEYIDYAMPQLTSQVQKTERDLTYDMANRGLLHSNAFNALKNSLAAEVNTQKQGIVDTGQSQANTLQQQVESQRSSLISQLEASADTSSTASTALSTAASLKNPSAYTPISNLLSNWANTYLNGLSTGNTTSTVNTTGNVYTAPLPTNTV